MDADSASKTILPVEIGEKFGKNIIIHDYFPNHVEDVPFGNFLNGIFFHPIGDNKDYPIHGPNVIRFVQALIENELGSISGLLKDDDTKGARALYNYRYSQIMAAMEVDLHESSKAGGESARITEILKIAAMYHDIGKFIRRANHPQIGTNLLRNFDEVERQKLVELLRFPNEPFNTISKHNRFSLIASLTQHHDKFGVVSTGEGGLGLFSDILYFTSDTKTISGAKKNVTSVMLLNLADIAAVNRASSDKKEQSLKIADDMYNLRNSRGQSESEKDLLAQLKAICEEPESSLGLTSDKITKTIDDWWIVIQAIENETVQGNRTQLKRFLMDIERNPARAIQRVLRLIQESAFTSNASCLVDTRFASPTSVESILVGILGAHQFQVFCQQFATIVKLDYGLAFFKAILCACIRKELSSNDREEDINPGRLTNEESKLFQNTSDTTKLNIAVKITTLFVRVLEGLITRYSGVLDASSANPRRFGFQMRDLTLDERIRKSIIDLLCIQDYKDPIALTWIADEVTIWSMD